MHPIIIIGAGLAGYQLARELRKINLDIPLTIVTADAGDYYSKPQLSTAFTYRKKAAELPTANADTMGQQLNATIFPHTLVTQIDPQHHMILTHQNSLPYRHLILACGADVIQPPLSGNARNEVLSINHIYHYTQFREYIQHKKSIAILGAGLIGCEFANDLSNAGYEVSVIAPAEEPLDLLIPKEIGRLLRSALEKNGVNFYLPCTVDSINKRENQYELKLSDGRELTADFVLSAIGLRPHVALAKTGGITINRGIVVNRYLQTNIANIYALGDCAEVEGHVLPFITPLLNCSRALAKTLTGTLTSVDYPAMPITVKTPAHPIVVCPPPKNRSGNWKITQEGNNLCALFYTDEKKLLGFVLTNEAVKQRGELVKQMPGLF